MFGGLDGWALVRWPRKFMGSLRRRIVPLQSGIEIRLEDLAPVWLRHNDDFRPLSDNGTRIGSTQEMSMAQAYAPPATARKSELMLPAAGGSVPSVEQSAMPNMPASSAFVRDYILPHQGLLQTQGVLVPLLKIIEMLETYGECPSVVLEAKTSDEESVDLYSIRDTLGQVTLKDHTHRVARHGMALLAHNYKDAEPLVPKMLVACLGHDLGKIPAFRASGIYSMRDHPAVSIVKVKEAFQGHDVFWLDRKSVV